MRAPFAYPWGADGEGFVLAQPGHRPSKGRDRIPPGAYALAVTGFSSPPCVYTLVPFAPVGRR